MAFIPNPNYSGNYPAGYNSMPGGPANMYGDYMNYPNIGPQQFSASPGMTPPTIHAEIVQVDDETAAANFKVATYGTPQMMIQKDDKAIYIKTDYANGTYDLDVYEKRKAPAVPPPYITREEFDQFRTELLATLQPAPSGKSRKESGNE